MHNAPTRRSWLAGSAALLAALTHRWAHAQPSYPSRAVTLVIGHTAGSPPDIFARAIADGLSAEWKQPVIVNNKPGASGILGITTVTRAPADGLTLLITSTALIQNTNFQAHLPYDPFKDLKPISLLATTALVFCVPATSPAKTLGEFIDRARARHADATSYMAPGKSTTQNIYATLLNRSAQLQLVGALYRDERLAVLDLISGRVGSGFLTVGQAASLEKAGSIRALGVTGTDRVTLLPHIPTLLELGYPGFETVGWFGMLAPAQTPDAIVQQVSRDLARAMARPEVQHRSIELALQPLTSTPAQYAEIMRRDNDRWRSIIKRLEIPIE